MNEPAAFDVTTLKVLVVGDNAFDRRVVMDLLIALGVQTILTAEDSVAAFAQMTLKKPDIVIADAEMSPFSGLMLIREIRASPIALHAVPMVLFTAETSADFAEMARGAGANEVLSKPVSALALRAALEEAILHPRTFGAASGPRVKARSVALDHGARAQILIAIDEARIAAGRWADTGGPALLETTRTAIDRAAEAAHAAGADGALTQALAGAARLTEAARDGLVDPRLLEVSLSAARAVLSAPAARNAMRQALAEAVLDAAEPRRANA